MENEFLIKFGVQSNIRIETLTEFLNSYRDLLYTINRDLGYSADDLIVEVSPPREGSFKIKIQPKYRNLLIGSVCTLLTGTLSGLLVVWISDSDKKLTIEDVEKILEHQNRSSVEINNIYKIYQYPVVRQALSNSFSAVSEDDNIVNLNISQNDVPVISVPKSDFEKHIYAEVDTLEVLKEPEKTNEVEAAVIIKTVHFEGDAKWGFIWNGYPIKASIKDENFLSRLNNEAFKRGDTLKVLLRKKSIFNSELNTYVVDERSYQIIEVLSHKSNNSENSLTISMND